jgi:hypothetical protein
MTDYVTVEEALAIHADQIERYGGSAGVRDPAGWKPRFFGLRLAITPV